MSEFQKLIQRVCDGDEKAADELVQLYGHHLVRCVRQRMRRHIRQHIDSEDAAQMVWKSFFADRQAMSEIQCPRQLVAYLVGMAHNKIALEDRKYQALKRGGRVRLVRLDQVVGTSHEPRSTAADPAELLAVCERYRSAVQGIPPRRRLVFELFAGGSSVAEISHVLAIGVRTVQRVIRNLRCHLQDRSASE